MEEKERVQKVMPMIMIAFALAGSLQEAFNICAPIIMTDFAISSSNVSLLSAVAMLTMGVAYVVYTALSDFMSVKKLLIAGIIISAVGSFGGLLFTDSFITTIIFRAIQMAGGTSSSALLILTASKYLDEHTRMKYYGYNTACFSGGQMVGIVLGGFFASYLGWRYLFIIPAFSLLTIPFILKYLPEDSKASSRKIDFIGIFLLASVSLFISLYFNTMNYRLLLVSLLIAIIFLVYISQNKEAFITINFFKNGKYMLVILIVLVTYLTQGSYSFLFSFMAPAIYGISPSQISLILVPSYLFSMIIGIFGSRITQKIGVMQTLWAGLGSMALGLLVGSFFLHQHIVLLIVISCLFNGGFAILYTPIMTLIMNSLPMSMRGTGLGFFNLCIKITSSTGIVITGQLLANPRLQQSGLVSSMSHAGTIYSNILLVFLTIILVSGCIITICKKQLLQTVD